MNIVIINPPRSNGLYVIREDRCEITGRESILPPYSLAQLASVLREQGHQIDLIDANCLDLTHDELKDVLLDKKELDAVIFRFTPTTFQDDMKVASITKQIDANIVTIGMCWTLSSFAEDVVKETHDLDIYVTGEPFISIPNIIDSLK